MKIMMLKSFRASVAYGHIDINKADYDELSNLTDQEAIEYINNHIYEFEIKGYDYSDIPSQLEFEGDELTSKSFDEEFSVQIA
jgi:hypothetical protein